MKNKENTKRKLLDAVGEIIKKSGFSGLGVNKVAKLSGVSKILIYRYFGDFHQMIKAYVAENNFWTNNVTDLPGLEGSPDAVREQIMYVLKERFNHFYNHCELEAILLNDTSGYKLSIKSSSNDNHLYNRKVDSLEEAISGGHQISYFNVVSALLVAGTDLLVLGGLQEKKLELQQSMGQLVEWTFGEALKV